MTTVFATYGIHRQTYDHALVSSRVCGYFFAAMGGLVSFITCILPLVQLFISGEALFEVTLSGRRQPERLPLGIEFVSIFLAMRLGFVGFGLGHSSSSRRQRIVWNGFSIANFLMLVAAVGSLVATVMLRDVGTLLFLLTPIVVGLRLWLATKHPAYRHAMRCTNSMRHQVYWGSRLQVNYSIRIT